MHSRSMNLVDLFQEAVEQQGDDDAVVDLSQPNPNGKPPSISYKDLDHASSRFASLLHSEYGVGPGDKVPLVTSRSISMVIATLAILKLRCCYIPIDASMWSSERIHSILVRLGSKVLVSTEKTFDSTTSNGTRSPKIANLDAWAEEQARLLVGQTTEMQGFNLGGQPDDLAYMIFTSGQ